VNSPIHRAVWEQTLPVELFEAAHESTPPDVQQVMSHSLDVVRRHRAAGTIYNAENKIADAVLTDLAGVGYWGLLVDRQYGGYGAPPPRLLPLLPRRAPPHPTPPGPP